MEIMVVDWKEIILSNWGLINRLAVHRFGGGPLAEEAALAVMNQLLENDGERLHGYQGRASVSAFLAAVSWRLLEDFSRRRFGRKRPPLWIRHLGGIWLQLYRLLCLERLDIAEAVAGIRQGKGDESAAELEEAAWTVRQQVLDCGAHQGLEVELDENQPVPDVSGEHPGEQARKFENRERQELFQMVFRLLTDASEETVDRNMGALCMLQVQLSPEEKLLLKLCYHDTISVTRAGEMLGLNRHQAHGRMRRLLTRLRGDFQRSGLDREILELLR